MIRHLQRLGKIPEVRLSSLKLQALSSNLAPDVSITDAPVTKPSPLQHPDYFNIHNLVQIKEMFDAKIHLGHREGSLHPDMRQYVLGSRLGHCIIDLDITAGLLRRALQVLAHTVYRGGLVLFLAPSGQPQVARATELLALKCSEFAHARPWQGGIFTNSEKLFGTVTRLPDLCVFLATPHGAIKDAAKLCIPSIAVLDTDANPDLVTYHIPGNDDSPSATNLYCNIFSETVLRAKAKRQLDAQ